MNNRNLHSPTKLTEFARDFDVEPDTFLTKFVNKLTNVYNSGYNTVNVVPTSSAAISIGQTSTNPLQSSTISQSSLSQTSSSSSLNSSRQQETAPGIQISEQQQPQLVKPDPIKVNDRENDGNSSEEDTVSFFRYKNDFDNYTKYFSSEICQ